MKSRSWRSTRFASRRARRSSSSCRRQGPDLLVHRRGTAGAIRSDRPGRRLLPLGDAPGGLALGGAEGHGVVPPRHRLGDEAELAPAPVDELGALHGHLVPGGEMDLLPVHEAVRAELDRDLIVPHLHHQPDRLGALAVVDALLAQDLPAQRDDGGRVELGLPGALPAGRGGLGEGGSRDERGEEYGEGEDSHRVSPVGKERSAARSRPERPRAQPSGRSPVPGQPRLKSSDRSPCFLRSRCRLSRSTPARAAARVTLPWNSVRSDTRYSRETRSCACSTTSR